MTNDAELEKLDSAHQKKVEKAHGDTPPGFAQQQLIDDPNTGHFMDKAEDAQDAPSKEDE